MIEPCAPWPRHALPHEDWARIAEPGRSLLALWADTVQVYALLRDATGEILFASTGVIEGGFPALSPAWPLASRFERMIRDLWGHAAMGGIDTRPSLDHGRWPRTAPMALRPGPPGAAEPPEFLPADDDTLDQVPIGPVRPGISPAAHLRLTVRGETIVRAETHLGYTHKGTLALIRGKSPRAAARFAARLVGEATVGHSIAFARATEAALGVEIPQRAGALRDLMAHIEHMAARLDQDAATEEALRRAANTAFGHRLMMDCVVPGGVAANIAPGGLNALRRALNEPLPELPEGPVSVALPNESGEGIGHAVGPHGDIWHWLRLDHGQIASAFLCDPAWAHWSQLEGALIASGLDDVAETCARFDLPTSGVDL
ncbi:MAG TPA: nickel-dependent hydrogenase large subunit [Acetobacteraceae bacterium]|nr:nickel-dependent hydrogenase large subunit [Acetobacteraceae bacterium]